jgi:hypothetical protein
MSDKSVMRVPRCRECGLEFPHLAGAWAQRALADPQGFSCAPCSLKPRCHAPDEACPTPDLCSDSEGCCWPGSAGS